MQTAVTHLRETQALAKMVGESPALLKTIEQHPAIAESDATVLIIGETGTEKELVAGAPLSRQQGFLLVRTGKLRNAFRHTI